MGKRKPRRRKQRANHLWLLLLIFFGIAAGAFFYPASHSTHRAARRAQSVPPAPSHVPASPISQATSATSARPINTPVGRTPLPSPSASQAGEHRLAIIIDDCGQWEQTERALIALPIPITMSVMPKERYTQSIAQEAAAAGKGVMLHLPMEPVANIDPGRGKITTAMTGAQILAQVQDDVALVPLATGVNNHEGSKATADPRVMQAVISALAARPLFFVDSRTSADSVAAQLAIRAGMRTASRDVFLDNEDRVDAIKLMLHQAADLALKNGSAIAIGHPRPATLTAIKELIPELQEQGITFTLASDLAH
ncbi:MAG: divergent polysaccharide deacetylase family protein [Candidatus Eremiobacteraeota bacterium]|nr:divergent polysaccharide deacetylase family protein [Candidatus Eremiobacteraeota bacterium]